MSFSDCKSSAFANNIGLDIDIAVLFFNIPENIDELTWKTLIFDYNNNVNMSQNYISAEGHGLLAFFKVHKIEYADGVTSLIIKPNSFNRKILSDIIHETNYKVIPYISYEWHNEKHVPVRLNYFIVRIISN